MAERYVAVAEVGAQRAVGMGNLSSAARRRAVKWCMPPPSLRRSARHSTVCVGIAAGHRAIMFEVRVCAGQRVRRNAT